MLPLCGVFLHYNSLSNICLKLLWIFIWDLWNPQMYYTNLGSKCGIRNSLVFHTIVTGKELKIYWLINYGKPLSLFLSLSLFPNLCLHDIFTLLTVYRCKVVWSVNWIMYFLPVQIVRWGRQFCWEIFQEAFQWHSRGNIVFLLLNDWHAILGGIRSTVA